MADRSANQEQETDAAAKVRVGSYKKSDGTKVSDYERTHPGRGRNEGKGAARSGRGEKRQTREGEADDKSNAQTSTPPPVHPSGDPKEPEFKKPLMSVEEYLELALRDQVTMWWWWW